MSEQFGTLKPQPGDGIRILEAKILSVLNGGGGGGGGSGGLSGSGSPQGVVTANPGTTYWDFTNKSLWVKDTGTSNTGWDQLIA